MVAPDTARPSKTSEPLASTVKEVGATEGSYAGEQDPSGCWSGTRLWESRRETGRAVRR